MDREQLIRTISCQLFAHDPGNTDCIQHEIYDEYDEVAELIAEQFIDYQYTLRHSMMDVFSTYFGEGYDQDLAREAYAEINRALNAQ